MGLRSSVVGWFCLGVLVLASACGETASGISDKNSTSTTTSGGNTGHPLSIGGLVASGMGGSSTGGGAAAQSSSGIGGQTSQAMSSMTTTASVGGGQSSGGEAGAPGSTTGSTPGSTTMGAGGEASCELFGCMPGGNVGVECGLEEPGVVWVCTSEPWGLGAEGERCLDMATQVPRYCCPLDFHPECL